MPNVYSVLLATVPSSPPGAFSLGGPPPGFKWVVKDMRATFTGGLSYPLQGFLVEDSIGGVLFAVQRPFAVTSYTFGWVGTQVVEVGDELIMNAGESGWSMRVSGYKLVLP